MSSSFTKLRDLRIEIRAFSVVSYVQLCQSRCGCWKLWKIANCAFNRIFSFLKCSISDKKWQPSITAPALTQFSLSKSREKSRKKHLNGQWNKAKRGENGQKTNKASPLKIFAPTRSADQNREPSAWKGGASQQPRFANVKIMMKDATCMHPLPWSAAKSNKAGVGHGNTSSSLTFTKHKLEQQFRRISICHMCQCDYHKREIMPPLLISWALRSIVVVIALLASHGAWKFCGNLAHGLARTFPGHIQVACIARNWFSRGFHRYLFRFAHEGSEK